MCVNWNWLSAGYIFWGKNLTFEEFKDLCSDTQSGKLERKSSYLLLLVAYSQ